MALSEIIIHTAVQLQTQKVIRESNYHLLRKYLLEKKPLLNVLNSIESLLLKQCKDDKEAMITELTQLNYKAQEEYDKQEAINDEQEQIHEHILKLNYTNELLALKDKLDKIETKCSQQELHCNHINQQCNELKIEYSQLNGALDHINKERQIRYPEDSNPQHLIYDAKRAWNELFQKENKLREQQTTLRCLIASQEAEQNKEQYNLTQYLQEKKEVEFRYDEIKQHIDSVFPEHQNQCQIRCQERLLRENARKGFNPIFQQLSPTNLDALKQHIENQSMKLENQRIQLTNEAIEMSYNTYLTQLEFALQNAQDTLQVTFTEHTALKKITSIMSKLVKMSEQENILIRKLNDERNNLQSFRDNLYERARNLLAPKSYLLQNNQLIKENTCLKLKSESAASYRKSALYAALFGMTGGLFTAGVLSTLIISYVFISPLFFTIPGALLMFSCVAMIIALSFHCQKYMIESKAKQHTQIMGENTAMFMEDWNKANQLIPDLNFKIEQSERALDELTLQLKEQQHMMNLELNKAQNVSSAYTGNSNFFISNTIDIEQKAEFPYAPRLISQLRA